MHLTIIRKKLWKEATLKALEEVQKAGVKVYYPDKSLFEKKSGTITRRI